MTEAQVVRPAAQAVGEDAPKFSYGGPPPMPPAQTIITSVLELHRAVYEELSKR